MRFINNYLSRINFHSLWYWGNKGGWAILDQGAFALSNFLVSILLARWLTPQQYGTFSSSFSIFLLISTIHAALLTEPLLIFGGGKYSNDPSHYLGAVIKIHLLLTIPIMAVGISAGLFLKFGLNNSLGDLFIEFSFAVPSILLLWIVRRMYLVLSKPKSAAISSILYLLSLMIILSVVERFELLSQFNVYYVLGACALFISLICLKNLSPSIYSTIDNFPDIVRDHWGYGKWALVISVLTWVAGPQAYYMILPGSIGLEGTGAMKALLNLVMPMLQGMAALSSFLIPILSASLTEGRFEKFRRLNILFFIFILISSIIYLLIMVNFGNDILSLLYDQKYVEYSNYLFFVGLLPFSQAISVVFGNALRVLGSMKKFFIGYFVAAIFTLVIGFPLSNRIGMMGALIGINLSYLIVGLGCIYYYLKDK